MIQIRVRVLVEVLEKSLFAVILPSITEILPFRHSVSRNWTVLSSVTFHYALYESVSLVTQKGLSPLTKIKPRSSRAYIRTQRLGLGSGLCLRFEEEYVVRVYV